VDFAGFLRCRTHHRYWERKEGPDCPSVRDYWLVKSWELERKGVSK
jgi:hypothetical protein